MAVASDDLYCFGARYKLGQPFIDSSKLRPGVLTNLGIDPIKRIDRVQRRLGDESQTIAYVYYNGSGLAALAPAVESDTTPGDKNEFATILSRIGLKAPPRNFIPGTRFGNGFALFFAGMQLDKALGPRLSVVACKKT